MLLSVLFSGLAAKWRIDTRYTSYCHSFAGRIFSNLNVTIGIVDAEEDIVYESTYVNSAGNFTLYAMAMVKTTIRNEISLMHSIKL